MTICASIAAQVVWYKDRRSGSPSLDNDVATRNNVSCRLTDGTVFVVQWTLLGTGETEIIRTWHLAADLTLLGTADIAYTTEPYSNVGMWVVPLPDNQVMLGNMMTEWPCTYATWVIDCSGVAPVSSTPRYVTSTLSPDWSDSTPTTFYDRATGRIVVACNDYDTLDPDPYDMYYQPLDVQVFQVSTGALLSELRIMQNAAALAIHMNPADSTDFTIAARYEPDIIVLDDGDPYGYEGDLTWTRYGLTIPLDGSTITLDSQVTAPPVEDQEQPVAFGSDGVLMYGLIPWDGEGPFVRTWTYKDIAGTTLSPAVPVGENSFLTSGNYGQQAMGLPRGVSFGKDKYGNDRYFAFVCEVGTVDNPVYAGYADVEKNMQLVVVDQVEHIIETSAMRYDALMTNPFIYGNTQTNSSGGRQDTCLSVDPITGNLLVTAHVDTGTLGSYNGADGTLAWAFSGVADYVAPPIPTARTHVYLPLTTPAGDLLPYADVTFLETGTSVINTKPLYRSADPSAYPIPNPATFLPAIVDIWCDSPVRLDLVIKGQDGYRGEMLGVDLLPSPENIAKAAVLNQISNAPQPNQVLLSDGTHQYWDYLLLIAAHDHDGIPAGSTQLDLGDTQMNPYTNQTWVGNLTEEVVVT